MPTFLRPGEIDGEGVTIAPAPHRRQIGLNEVARLRRLKVYCSWYFLRHERGLTVADIAEVFDRPLSTVKLGLKLAARHLEAEGLLERSAHVPTLTPMLGCQPWPPKATRDGSCPICRDHVESDSLYCANPDCHRVSDRNERKLAVQRVKADAEERRTAENWAKTAPKPRPTPKLAPLVVPMMATA